MVHDKDIKKIQKTSTKKDQIYTFLDGLDGQFDLSCQDILQQTPLLLVEQTFAQVKREHNRRTLMMETTRVDDNSFGLLIKGQERDT
jgi:hypothetical protein